MPWAVRGRFSVSRASETPPSLRLKSADALETAGAGGPATASERPLPDGPPQRSSGLLPPPDGSAPAPPEDAQAADLREMTRFARVSVIPLNREGTLQPRCISHVCANLTAVAAMAISLLDGTESHRYLWPAPGTSTGADSAASSPPSISVSSSPSLQ